MSTIIVGFMARIMITAKADPIGLQSIYDANTINGIGIGVASFAPIDFL